MYKFIRVQCCLQTKKVRNVSVIGLYHKTREITVHKRQSLKSNMTSIKRHVFDCRKSNSRDTANETIRNIKWLDVL